MRDSWPDWIKKDVLRMISVDVETAGPNPTDYALLSIGACTLTDPRKKFYVELKPTTMKVDLNALQIHQLDLLKLSQTGEFLIPKINPCFLDSTRRLTGCLCVIIFTVSQGIILLGTRLLTSNRS